MRGALVRRTHTEAGPTVEVREAACGDRFVQVTAEGMDEDLANGIAGDIIEMLDGEREEVDEC